MSKWIVAIKTPEKLEKFNVDLAASGVTYKERLNMPVIAEVVMREQPENLRDDLLERLRYYREESLNLPRSSDSQYTEMTNQNINN
ncbi:DNA polymerase III subunit theta [Enterobacter bugandensis]|uniref:DNA polymerase III subunit theta n=1 Tax=Enterobacter bugandensis TaxID=881260 RepID=UPI0004806557|nr:DNA polymerase III subunit theta [Enterobacter bugandensis]MCK6728534.1 DNA polymerase III subunit theta [Enterobacter bugandensis]